jgi:hypothetical protein
MWTHEHTAETDLAPEAIWRVLSDIDNWTAWDTSMDQISIHGLFAVGTTISMTPSGQDQISSTIVEIEPNRRYADETSFGGVTLRFCHRLDPRESGGTTIRHSLEISGSDADRIGPELGPQITEDFPEAMAGLIAHAAALAASTT